MHIKKWDKPWKYAKLNNETPPPKIWHDYTYM